MHTPTGDATWCQVTESHGLFRVEIPASWRMAGDPRVGPFRHGQHGRWWEGHLFVTDLLPPPDEITLRRMSVTIRVEQFAETPPPIFKDFDEPTDVSYLRTYRIAHDRDWLSCTVGHLRVHVQYEIAGVPDAYHPLGWEPPPPLSPAERQERLALVQRILASFELLADDRAGEDPSKRPDCGEDR